MLRVELETVENSRQQSPREPPAVDAPVVGVRGDEPHRHHGDVETRQMRVVEHRGLVLMSSGSVNKTHVPYGGTETVKRSP